MLDSEKFQIAAGVNYQSLGSGEDGVLLSMSSGYLYRCNHTTLEILDAVKERPTYAELLSQFAERHGLESGQAHADLSRFLGQLLEEQLIARAA